MQNDKPRYNKYKKILLLHYQGKLPEWSIGTVSKTVVRVTVPRVRIPDFPQPKCQELVKARKINDLRAFSLLSISKIFNKKQTFGDLFGYPKILKFRVTEFAQNTFIFK